MQLSQINFPKILVQRIRICRSFDKSRRRSSMSYARESGFGPEILKLYKERPVTSLAIIFSLAGSGRFDVWLDPWLKPSCRSPDSMHYELYHGLLFYLEQHVGRRVQLDDVLGHEEYVSAAVYGYPDGMRLLSLDSMNDFPTVPDELRKDVERQTPIAARLLEMMGRYGFRGIYGPTGKSRWFDGRRSELGEKKFMIIPPASLDNIRQDRYLWLVARRHGLSVAEYLRFRCFALSAHAAGVSCEYENLIRLLTERQA